MLACGEARGEPRGYMRHYKANEPACADCLDAVAADRRERRRRGEGPRRRRQCGTHSSYVLGCRCVRCRKAHNRYRRMLYRRQRRIDEVTCPSVICDVLETAGTSMGWRSLIAWVTELHPEWTEGNVRRTLHRLVAEGRVERMEFGAEIRYRI